MSTGPTQILRPGRLRPWLEPSWLLLLVLLLAATTTTSLAFVAPKNLAATTFSSQVRVPHIGISTKIQSQLRSLRLRMSTDVDPDAAAAAAAAASSTLSIETIMEELRGHREAFLQAMKDATSVKDAQNIKVQYLGKKGPIMAAMGCMRQLSDEDKPKLGAVVNEIKAEFEEIVVQRKDELEIEEGEAQMKAEAIDVTKPGLRPTPDIGRRHPLSMTMQKAVDVFRSLGYDTVTGVENSPEIETDYYCFEALNCPKDHPARDMQDTFYLSEDRELLLRTHTSSVQIRYLEKQAMPDGTMKNKEGIRIVAPGRVYRRDDIDATHSLMFHQVEILALEPWGQLNLGHLKGTVEYFLKNMLGPQIKTRFRGSFFPFTEPSMEVDVWFRGRWMEVLGCGMVDPRVLKNVGIDPKRYAGFAAGFGVERFAMIIHGVDDLREFVKNDVRFTRQFPYFYDTGLESFLAGKMVEKEPDYRLEECPDPPVTSLEELKERYEQHQRAMAAAGTAAKTDAVDGGKTTNGKAQEEDKSSSPPAPAPDSDDVDISKLNIRVGVITKAWEHPEADKLYCEEIDIGEEEPRLIASGLREHYDLDDLVGQRVLVLANLKARKMLGFSSHGMVLCADDGAGSVKFVTPPLQAKVGERITVPTYEGEPATENQIVKKKMLPILFPDLRTDGRGVATFRGRPLLTSAGPCICNELPDAEIK